MIPDQIELRGGPADGEVIWTHPALNSRFHYRGWWYEVEHGTRTATAIEPCAVRGREEAR